MFEQTTNGAVKTPVPEWSGHFMEIGEGVGLMRVHNSDVRQHFGPPGWMPIGHSTFEDGSFEAYVFAKVSLPL